MAVFASRQIVLPQMVNYVNFIQSSGAQKIDTGVAVKSTIGYEVEFALTVTSGQQGVIGGFTYGGYNHNFAGYDGKWFTQYGNNAGYQFGTTDTNKHTLSQNVTIGAVTFDGTTIQTGLTYYDNTDKTFALFCYNGGSSYPQFWPGSLKLYRCKMYDNGTLVRDLWPCYDPDGVACLYDKVEKKYYYNAGSGEFIAGEAA